jgi:hypothetical protein
LEIEKRSVSTAKTIVATELFIRMFAIIDSISGIVYATVKARKPEIITRICL